MENASKAMIIAGGVLISIAVISLALYFRSVLSGYTMKNEEIYTASQINSFNRFYEAYDNGTGKIDGIDMFNIYNKAKDDGITTDGSYKGGLTSDNYLNKYGYTISYDSQGRVSKVTLGN